MADTPYGPAFQPFQLPEYEKKHETGTTTKVDTGYREDVRTEEQKQVLDRNEALQREREKILVAKQAQGMEHAGVQSDIASEGATIAEQSYGDRLQAMEQSRGLIDTWRGHLKTAQERYNAAPTPALFADRDNSSKFLLAVGMAFGALGDAMSRRAMIRIGMRPDDTDTVGKIINLDLERQRANIARLSDRVVQARTGLNDAMQARQLMLAEVDAREAAMYKRAEKLGAARLAAMGKQQKEIEGNEEIIKSRQGAVDAQIKSVDGLKRQINNLTEKTNTDATTETNRDPTSKGAKVGTEEKQKAALFSSFANHATWLADNMGALKAPEIEAINQVLANENFLNGKQGYQAVLAALGEDVQRSIGSEAKSYLARASFAIDSLLRLRSGAAVTESEFNKYMNMLKPLMSDSPQDILNRANLIREELETSRPFFEVKELSEKAREGVKRVREGGKTETAAKPTVKAEKDSPEDVNSEAPLKEDPKADEAAPITKKGKPVKDDEKPSKAEMTDERKKELIKKAEAQLEVERGKKEKDWVKIKKIRDKLNELKAE